MAAEARVVLERELPTIVDYYDQIRDMTLVQVAPRSNGNITEAKLATLQAEFDRLAQK